jgi:hypothetical protein
MKQVNVRKLLRKAAYQRDRLIHQDKNKDSKTVPYPEAEGIVYSQPKVPLKELVLRETYFTYSINKGITEKNKDLDSRKLSPRLDQKIDFDFSKKADVNLTDRSKSFKEPPVRIVSPISGIKGKTEPKRSLRVGTLSRSRVISSRRSGRREVIIQITNPLAQQQDGKSELAAEEQRYDLAKAKRFLENQMALFEDCLDQLLSNYLNKYVWFENGVVLDSGNTHEEVAMRAYKAHGMKPIFIKKVEKDKVVFSTPTSFN